MLNDGKYKVLVVEDERSIRRFICINLQREGFDIIEAETGENAINCIHKNKPDIVLLDIMLPDIDGFEVCNRIREIDEKIAIIMLTARGQEMDKVMGFDLGSDDYIVKPFNPLELIARIKAVLKRVNGIGQDKLYYIATGNFKIDLYSYILYKNEKKVELAPKEFNLVKILIQNPGKAFSRDELLDEIWGKDFLGDAKTLDVHVRRLREKIEDDPSEPEYVETVWGFGYRWREVK